MVAVETDPRVTTALSHWAGRTVADGVPPVEHLHVKDGGHVVNDLPHRYRPQSADLLAQQLRAEPV